MPEHPSRRAPSGRSAHDRPARRPVNWRRRLAIAGVLVVVVATTVGFFVVQRAIAFNDAVSSEPALSARLFGPFAGDERRNVLLLGYSDETREGAFLSDSMNVLSVDPATDTVSMIPIPRDLWVEGLAEVPENLKINEAFRIGTYAEDLTHGAELAAAAVTHVTGLEIHAWISLDFQGFEAMVDAIGGVTIENPTAFSYTWDEASWQAGSFSGSFDAGTLHLDGSRALDYARNRYTSVVAESSDFARLVRQQRVLQAIRAEISGWRTVPTGLAVAESVEGHLRTNLSVLDLAMLAGKLDPDRRIELAEDVILRASTNTLGQYILVVIGQETTADYEPLHRFIAEALADPVPPSPSPSNG
jgi:LCP family protein required for cell wall assembly